MVDVSLYFHIPFCSHKCGYCHFYVLPDKEALKRQYLDALYLEWQKVSAQLENKKIVSIYFGGGTPSLLEPSDIAAVIGAFGSCKDRQVRGLLVHVRESRFASGSAEDT